MKVFLFFVFFLVEAHSFGQNILWEKKFGWQLDDQLIDGFALSANHILAVGTSFKYGTSVNGNIKNGLIATKINTETGDTIWFKAIGMYCETPKCVLGDNGLFYIIASETVIPYRQRLLIIDTSGNLFFAKTLDSTGVVGTRIEKLIRTNDGNFLVIGTRRGVASNLTVDMFAMKFDGLGTVLWNNRFNANPNSGGNHVEETPEGHYLLSGNAGSKIWRVEVDSDGNQISSNFLYQTPSFVNFDERTSVKEHPFSTRVLSGNINGSNSRYYFGYYQSNTNQKIWGGEQGGGIQKPYIHTDGSILQMRANFGYWFNKYNPDSSINWSITFTGKFGAQNFFLNSAIYFPDSSAIFVGKIGYVFTSQGDDFYFCRISNVGVPYDPSKTVSVNGHIKGEGLIPYPNPVASSLVFKGLKEDGVLFLYDLKGQIVKEMPIKPYQWMYINEIPKGLYLYRIQTKGGGFYSGKIVKD